MFSKKIGGLLIFLYSVCKQKSIILKAYLYDLRQILREWGGGAGAVWLGGHNKCGMLLVELVIFLIYKEIVFLEKMFSKVLTNRT